MVSPEVPGSGAVGKPVLHDQPDGQGDDAVRVVASGQGQVFHSGVEIGPAMKTAMLGIRELDVPGTARHRVPKVVEGALDFPESVGALPTTLASPPLARTLPSHDLGLRKVFNTCDALGGVGKILSRSCHANSLQNGLPHPGSIGNPTTKLDQELCIYATVSRNLNGKT